MLTLTHKDGKYIEVDSASITEVKSLNPLSALAHNAKSLITINGIESVMVKEDAFTIMDMIVQEVFA